MTIGLGIETSGGEIFTRVGVTGDFIVAFERDIALCKNYGPDIDDILIGYTCGTELVTSRLHPERRSRFLKQTKRLCFDIRFHSEEVLDGGRREFLSRFVSTLCQKLSHETKRKRLAFSILEFENDIKRFEETFVRHQESR